MKEEPRNYRRIFKGNDLVYFTCKVKQTDLCIGATHNLREQAEQSVKKYRKQVEEYIRLQPVFLNSLKPVEALPGAPGIIQQMIRASQVCGVGPMASIAGAVSLFVAKDLRPYSRELVIENGGDLYLEGNKERVVSVFAGESDLTGKIGLRIKPEFLPLSICTSSGTVGHSLSFGRADAVVVLSKDACLADAAATAIGNIVKCRADIEKVLNQASSIPEISGILVITGEDMGVWGNVELVRL